MSSMPLSKTLALPPTFVDEWRHAMDALRGPPTLGLREAMDALRGPPTLGLREAMDALRGPPSTFQQLRVTECIREGTDLDDALGHARAPARPPPPAPATTTTRRGAPTIHVWDTIERLDAAFTARYFADNKRVPGWKEREDALREVLGNTTPHLKTLQQHLPKIALLKERNSRSI
jgi:hypothetical protein